MLVYPVGSVSGQKQLADDAVNYKPRTRRPSVPVNSACNHCRRLHARCEDQRPCKRCVASGRGMDCFDPEHKKRGRPRIYDVSINKPTFEIAPKNDARHHPTIQPRYTVLPQHRPEKSGLLLPLPQERGASVSQYFGRESVSSQFHMGESTCPQLVRTDSVHLRFRRDSTSSQASSAYSANAHTSMLPGAGTPPDTPSAPVWRNPFASDSNKWIYGEGGKVRRRECEGPRGIPPEAKKGRCLSIDELLC